MTFLKVIKITKIVVLIIFLFASCTKKTFENTNKEIQVTDYANRIVTLEKPAEKIVVMADNALVIVKQLKAVDKVVALDSKTKSNLPLSILSEINPKLNELPDVGKTKSPNYEYIMSLSPDLILFKGNKQQADTIEEKTGVPVASVLSLEGYDFEIYKMVGKLLGRATEAEKLIASFQSYKKSLEEKVAGIDEENKKRAYIVVQNSKNDLFKTQKASMSLDLANIANLAVSANDVDEWGFANISKEETLKWQPDFVLLDIPVNATSISKAAIQNDSTLKFWKCVSSGDGIFYTHTFTLPKDYVYVISEAYYYANLAYPEVVTDTDFANAVNSIFNFAYGIENYYESFLKTLSDN